MILPASEFDFGLPPHSFINLTQTQTPLIIQSFHNTNKMVAFHKHTVSRFLEKEKPDVYGQTHPIENESLIFVSAYTIEMDSSKLCIILTHSFRRTCTVGFFDTVG